MPVSIVIRALNEATPLRKLLPILADQDYTDQVQLIVVDNESHDDTATVAQSFGAEVVNLPRKQFSYPHSMNVGLAAAHHEAVILMAAHAYPFARDWLTHGLSHLADPQVAGVYANVIPYENATPAELAFYMPNYEAAKLRGPFAVKKSTMGILGATNCVIRRSLWQQHPFDERYGLGGEDGEWAQWAMNQGYKIINDFRFSVRHAHALKEGGLDEQIAYWQSLGQPQPFDAERLDFRKDISFD